MRAYIQSVLRNELVARKLYYYDVFGTYMIEAREGNGFIELVSMPSTYEDDIVFFVGHNGAIYKYLSSNIKCILEHIIVLVTCKGKFRFDKLSLDGKNIYIARQTDNYATILKKEDYYFDFDPVESEVVLYNLRNKYPIMQCINKAFVSIKRR